MDGFIKYDVRAVLADGTTRVLEGFTTKGEAERWIRGGTIGYAVVEIVRIGDYRVVGRYYRRGGTWDHPSRPSITHPE